MEEVPGYVWCMAVLILAAIVTIFFAIAVNCGRRAPGMPIPRAWGRNGPAPVHREPSPAPAPPPKIYEPRMWGPYPTPPPVGVAKMYFERERLDRMIYQATLPGYPFEARSGGVVEIGNSRYLVPKAVSDELVRLWDLELDARRAGHRTQDTGPSPTPAPAGGSPA